MPMLLGEHVRDKEISKDKILSTGSVLATADASGDATSPGTSPALAKAQPAISEVAKGNQSESGPSNQAS